MISYWNVKCNSEMVLVLLNMCCIHFLSLDTNAEKFFFKAPLENSDGLHFKTEHHVPVHQQVKQKIQINCLLTVFLLAGKVFEFWTDVSATKRGLP